MIQRPEASVQRITNIKQLVRLASLFLVILTSCSWSSDIAWLQYRKPSFQVSFYRSTNTRMRKHQNPNPQTDKQTFAFTPLLHGSRPQGNMARQATFGPVYLAEAPSSCDAAVIWLHGLGDTGEGWADVGPQLQQQFPSVRFLFPTAPSQPVTVNMGMVMPSWFDINSLQPELFKLNPLGMSESAEFVRSLVKDQRDAGIAAERIILAGFSQGGAVVLEAALGQVLNGKVDSVNVGGVFVLSSFVGTTLPLTLRSPLPAVHFFHGEADAVVPLDWGRRSVNVLQKLGLKPSFKSYPGMQHSACMEEIADIASALRQILFK